jgi:hypothetical protein
VFGEDLEGLSDTAFCVLGRTYGRAPLDRFYELDLIYGLPLPYKNAAFHPREDLVQVD